MGGAWRGLTRGTKVKDGGPPGLLTPSVLQYVCMTVELNRKTVRQ